MNPSRSTLLASLNSTPEWDVVVIGGGASGLGTALDAISRGLKVLLIEKVDFGHGTSSRSTKLVHGGVRYLAQGYVRLVMEALKERKYLLDKASHLSHVQKFIIPVYTYYDFLQYNIGLRLYDLLAANKSIGNTKWCSKKEVLASFPSLNSEGLIGGVSYTDGAFDDARLCIDLVSTINSHGGVCINHMGLISIDKLEENIASIICRDTVENKEYQIKSKVFVNATGVHAGTIMKEAQMPRELRILPSQGTHVVIDKLISPNDVALMIPQTTDGRVLFAIPWKGKFLIGTTDVLMKDIDAYPLPTKDEVSFILSNVKAYFSNNITNENIIAQFAGLRPLAAPAEGSNKTKEVSRSHKIIVTANLVSIVGGKWTTFRKIGQDTIDKAMKKGILHCDNSKSAILTIECATRFTNINPVHTSLPYSIQDFENVIKNEYVESLSDLLCRRTRCTFIDEQATRSIVDKAAEVMAKIKNWSEVKKQEEIRLFLNSGDLNNDFA
jgi:glycerol-3-phosphate dehydrogenase